MLFRSAGACRRRFNHIIMPTSASGVSAIEAKGGENGEYAGGGDITELGDSPSGSFLISGLPIAATTSSFYHITLHYLVAGHSFTASVLPLPPSLLLSLRRRRACGIAAVLVLNLMSITSYSLEAQLHRIVVP